MNTAENNPQFRRPALLTDNSGFASDVLIDRRILPMLTTILVYVIALAGLVTIAAGIWGFLILLTEKTVRVPLRYYATVLGLISGGLGLEGLAQALRLLLALIGRG